jgi:hypothetical protein
MILFWKTLIITVIVVYFSAAAVVAVKGFKDMLLMLSDLRGDGEE